MAAVDERFASEPCAPQSAQFPLGPSVGEPGDLADPSPPGVRPWILVGMRPARQQGTAVLDSFHYSHDEQVAVTNDGRYLTAGEPTVKKVTSNDGDEGPSEDFTYDYCLDSPPTV